MFRNRRSIGDLLEKTKYSLVANSSNYHISELVSSGNKLAVRFFAKQGRLPGRGFRAKFKIGKSLRSSAPRAYKVLARVKKSSQLPVAHFSIIFTSMHQY